MVYFDNFGIMKKVGDKTVWAVTFLLTLTSLFTACSSDDAAEQQGGEQSSAQGKAKVTLRIAPDNADGVKVSTRAGWQDENAKTDRSEMMYSWHVVLVDASNKVVFKQSNTTVDVTNAEIDVVANELELAVGTYTAYSFANIADSSLPDANISVGGTLSPDAMTNATFTVNGNGFTPSATNGIPMSNKQTLTIAAGDTEKDLIVIRMLAKITLSVTNQTGAEVVVKNITLSDVTANDADNLKLLPKLTSGADDMNFVHKDIEPNLNRTPSTVNYSPALTTGGEAIANNGTKDITFYVNESATPTNSDQLFNLTLELNNAEYRYSVINQKGKQSGDDDAWNYIARNDYRILPIVLDDYKLELIPYDFPAIGVYPASVRAIDETQNLYEMTFHDYGHFHLLPKVTKTSGASTVVYSATTPSGTAWTLDTDFAGSWKTAATKGGAWVADGNPGNFYRTQSTPDTNDADEAGGVPVWYANTSSPQWDPAGGSNYQPFIFGYIADPEASLTEDKKIYHEFRVKLYVDGAYRRDMIYRFYMTLSENQMSYTRGMNRPDGTTRLPHNHIFE